MASPGDRLFYRYKGRFYPTPRLVEVAHLNAIERFGGLTGLRDAGALQSALSAPLDSAVGEDAYGTFYLKTAALGFRLAKNHPFQDANKRTAWLAVEATLRRNGYYPSRPVIELEDVMVLMAAGHLSTGVAGGLWPFT